MILGCPLGCLALAHLYAFLATLCPQNKPNPLEGCSFSASLGFALGHPPGAQGPSMGLARPSQKSRPPIQISIFCWFPGIGPSLSQAPPKSSPRTPQRNTRTSLGTPRPSPDNKKLTENKGNPAKPRLGLAAEAAQPSAQESSEIPSESSEVPKESSEVLPI